MTTAEAFSNRAAFIRRDLYREEAIKCLASYMETGSDREAKECKLDKIVKGVIEDPKGPHANALRTIAKRVGDPGCARVVEPLLIKFRNSDDELLQMAIILTLGSVAHLTDECWLDEIVSGLAHVAVSEDLFCVGMRTRAANVIEGIFNNLRHTERFRHPYLPLHQCRAQQIGDDNRRRCVCDWTTPCDFRGEWSDQSWYGEFPCNASIPCRKGAAALCLDDWWGSDHKEEARRAEEEAIIKYQKAWDDLVKELGEGFEPDLEDDFPW